MKLQLYTFYFFVQAKIKNPDLPDFTGTGIVHGLSFKKNSNLGL